MGPGERKEVEAPELSQAFPGRGSRPREARTSQSKDEEVLKR